MASAQVKERSTAYLTVTFFDKTKQPETPASVSYSVHCMTTNTVVRGSTSLSAASAVEITLTPADTTIINPSNAFERKRVTVEATYGAADAVRDQFDFLVVNLSRVS